MFIRCSAAQGNSAHLEYFIQIEISDGLYRDSRYLGHLLRNKSATRGTDGEGEPMPERRDEVMPEPGGSFELGGCLTSCVYDHDTSWR